MSLDAADLPDDAEARRRLVLEERRVAAAARAEAENWAGQLRQAQAGLVAQALEIEKLKVQLARLRRMRFGRRISVTGLGRPFVYTQALYGWSNRWRRAVLSCVDVQDLDRLVSRPARFQ
jgi:hypothetical protein